MPDISFVLAPITPVASSSGGSIGSLVFYISIAICFSFLCSILEAVLLSTSHSHVETLAAEGSRAARLMQHFKQNVEAPISAILTLNTIAHTVGATTAGAEAAIIFGDAYIGLISAVLTLLILVFSEIIPKTLGALYWRQLMPFAAYAIQLLVWSMYPAVKTFQVLGRVLGSGHVHQEVTRAEIEVMAQLSAQGGGLGEHESRVLKNLLHLNSVQLYDVMTPRTVMFTLQQDLTVGEVLEQNRALPYSRIPIFNENHDDIIGFVLRHEIFTFVTNDRKDTKLIEMKRPLHSVPDTLSVTKVLDEFITRDAHIFLVFDEYGGTAGIITMEDAMESLLGVEITDESDIVADMRVLAQNRYRRQMELRGVE